MVTLHVFRNNSTISSVYKIDESLRMFFAKLFDYIECLQSSTTTLCVVALSTCAVCMFSLMYGYFDCFSTIDISSLHVFVIIRLHCMYFVIIALFRVFTKSMNHFGCFLQNCLTTLNVYNQVQLLCVLLHFRLVQFACFHLCTVTLIVSLQLFLCKNSTIQIHT